MFLPFLPLILASLSLTLFSEELERTSPIWNLPIGLAMFGFLCLSFLLAQIPQNFSFGKGAHPTSTERSGQLTTPRSLSLILWLALVYNDHLDLRLQQTFEYFTEFQSISIGILLITCWLADSIAAIRMEQWDLKGLTTKLMKSARHLRLQLPVLILSLIQFVLFWVLNYILPESRSYWSMLLEMLFSLALMMILAPVVLVKSWGALYLTTGVSYELIQDELEKTGTPIAGIVAWPESILPHTTAGVMGIVKGFRYLLISPKLLENLKPEELRAVIAHEAGHIKRQHLLFYLIGFFAFIELLSLAGSLDLMMEWAGVWEISGWFAGLFSVLSLVLFVRFGIGFLSQNFERQADCHSYERTGITPIAMALKKVAWLNGINPFQDNWHHYGIQQRIDFLVDCEAQPEKLALHHNRVKRIKISCLVFLFTLLGLNALVNTENIKIEFLTWKLNEIQNTWKKEDSPLLTRMADHHYFKNEKVAAEKWYRKSLKLNPMEAHTLNNLAWLLTEINDDLHEERLAESISLAKKALAIEQAAFIWDTLAQAYWKNGDHDLAHEASLKALKLAENGSGLTKDTDLHYYQKRHNEMLVQ